MQADAGNSNGQTKEISLLPMRRDMGGMTEQVHRLLPYTRTRNEVQKQKDYSGPAGRSVDKQRQVLDEMIFWHAMSRPSIHKNPCQQFEEVHRAFIGSYWTLNIINSVAQYNRIYHWLAPHSRALNAARDALCLLHLGSRLRDKQLLMEGRMRHVAALRCLGEEIVKPNAVNDDSVLGASYTIAQCEVGRAIRTLRPG